jgi:hypothetical protein
VPLVIYGWLVLSPGFFLERQIGIQSLPAITHPEVYYGLGSGKAD